MKRLALILVSLLSVACGPILDFDTSALSEDQTKIAQRAADKWCAATGDCPRMGVSDSPSVIWLTDDLTLTRGGGGRCVMEQGIVDIRILYAATTDDETFFRVILHELGHAIGCNKHLLKGNAMAFSSDETPGYLTAEDIKCAKGN